MNHLLVGVLVLCALSIVLCHTDEDSADFTRCPLLEFPPECNDYIRAYWQKQRSMTENKEIGSCPEPKSCRDCWEDDNIKVRRQIDGPTAVCKKSFAEYQARKKYLTGTSQALKSV